MVIRVLMMSFQEAIHSDSGVRDYTACYFD
jgi:hypothetical protein